MSLFSETNSENENSEKVLKNSNKKENSSHKNNILNTNENTNGTSANLYKNQNTNSSVESSRAFLDSEVLFGDNYDSNNSLFGSPISTKSKHNFNNDVTHDPWASPSVNKKLNHLDLNTIINNLQIPQFYTENFNSAGPIDDTLNLKAYLDLFKKADLDSFNSSKISSALLGSRLNDIKSNFRISKIAWYATMALIAIFQLDPSIELSLETLENYTNPLPLPKFNHTNSNENGLSIINNTNNKVSVDSPSNSMMTSTKTISITDNTSNNTNSSNKNNININNNINKSNTDYNNNLSASLSFSVPEAAADPWSSSLPTSSLPVSRANDILSSSPLFPSNEFSFSSTRSQSASSITSVPLSHSTPEYDPRSEDTIKVTLIPEKEGLFMFRHVNYLIEGGVSPATSDSPARGGQRVVRRYSDFVWLLECLLKRYPFRIVPLLPPKKLAVNGHYLSSDVKFLERRRRGLARFCNSLVRHPVLSKEILVQMFLSIPSELSLWKKQANYSLEEEFNFQSAPIKYIERWNSDYQNPDISNASTSTRNSNSKTMSASFSVIPNSFGAYEVSNWDSIRQGVRESVQTLTHLLQYFDKIARRQMHIAKDYVGIAGRLADLEKITKDIYTLDANAIEGGEVDDPISMISAGLRATSSRLDNSHSLVLDESAGWDVTVLEDLRRHRDWMIAAHEMFQRYDKLSGNNISQLEKRVKVNESRLTSATDNLSTISSESVSSNSSTSGANNESNPTSLHNENNNKSTSQLAGMMNSNTAAKKIAEIDRLKTSIEEDKASISNQIARMWLIRFTISNELRWFQTSVYGVSKIIQDWAADKVKYSELLSDNWKRLSVDVEPMPLSSE